MDLEAKKDRIKNIENIVSKLKDGDTVSFTPFRDDPEVEGVISIFNNKMYVCQDFYDGETLSSEYKKDKMCSWVIKKGSTILTGEIHSIKLYTRNKQYLLPLY